MSKQVKSYYEATRYLGQYIGQDHPFLKLTACMGLNRRMQIGVMRWIVELEEKGFLEKLEELSLAEALDKIIIPLLEKMGYAEWPRDTVTDMAIKRALTSEEESFESFKPENASTEVSEDS